MIRYCKVHGYTPHRKRVDGGYRCRKCSSENKRNKRNTLKIQAVEYLGGECSVCGYNKCINALEFHHRNPDEKDFAISRSSRLSFEDIKSELDKCDILCANCHRELHAGDNIET